MPSPRATDKDQQQFDHNVDRYPNFREAMQRIATVREIPQGPVGRVEVNFLANGEATYRVWAPRAEDPEGGVLPPPE